MKRKYVLSLGAVVIALLMASSVTAVNVTRLNKTEDALESDNYGVDVDPCIGTKIYLTDKEFSQLRGALPYIDNPETKLVVQGLINIYNEKGYLEISEIQNLFEELGLILSGVYPLGSSIEGHGGGRAYAFPGSVRAYGFLPFLSKGGLMWWFTHRTGEVIIKTWFREDPYGEGYNGLSIGFVGYVWTVYNPSAPDFYLYLIGGLGIFTLVWESIIGSNSQQTSSQQLQSNNLQSNPILQNVQTQIQAGQQSTTVTSMPSSSTPTNS